MAAPNLLCFDHESAVRARGLDASSTVAARVRTALGAGKAPRQWRAGIEGCSWWVGRDVARLRMLVEPLKASDELVDVGGSATENGVGTQDKLKFESGNVVP